jgi:hypothetical protein
METEAVLSIVGGFATILLSTVIWLVKYIVKQSDRNNANLVDKFGNKIEQICDEIKTTNTLLSNYVTKVDATYKITRGNKKRLKHLMRGGDEQSAGS